MRDPRLGFLTVTEVAVSRDLRHASVFVSVLGDADAKTATMDGLRSAVGYIRRALGQRLQTRYTPDITFKLDESIERGARVNKLLGDVAKESHAHPPSDDRGDPKEQS